MKLSRLICVSGIVALASLSIAQTLNIGDKAPALKVTDWVKGSKQKLGNGNITVVEFWATWCGPCKVSIPHLTEMAKKYRGKVNFVGVSISEASLEDYKTKVPAFVKQYGDKMAYNVATEGPNKFMSTNWMKASGERGIPSSFLVDQRGKIVWIGHPMFGLDAAIDELLSGKLNIENNRKAREKAKLQEAEQLKAQQEMRAIISPINTAIVAKKYTLAVKEAEKVVTKDSEIRSVVDQYKLMAMALGNLEGLREFTIKLGNDYGTDANMLNHLVTTLVEDDLNLPADVYTIAEALGEKMMKLEPNNAMNLYAYSFALWRVGKKSEALETQKKAVELASQDKNFPDELVKDMRDHLKKFGG